MREDHHTSFAPNAHGPFGPLHWRAREGSQDYVDSLPTVRGLQIVNVMIGDLVHTCVRGVEGALRAFFAEYLAGLPGSVGRILILWCSLLSPMLLTSLCSLLPCVPYSLVPLTSLCSSLPCDHWTFVTRFCV